MKFSSLKKTFHLTVLLQRSSVHVIILLHKSYFKSLQ